jgi:hypothetical protein
LIDAALADEEGTTLKREIAALAATHPQPTAPLAPTPATSLT